MVNERRSRIKIRVENKDYDVIGDDFQQILTAVKALPNRRFNGGLKLWEVAGSVAMVQGQLENSGFRLEGGSSVPEPEMSETTAPADRIRVKVAGYPLLVTGASFQAMLEIIKAISGRRFDGETKHWALPGSLREIKTYFEKKGLRLEAQQGQPDLATILNTEGDNLPSQPEAPTDQGASELHWPPSNSVEPPPPPPPLDLSPLDDGGRYFEDEEEFVNDSAFIEGWSLPPESFSEHLLPTQVERQVPQRTGPRDQIRVVVGNKPLVVTGGSFQAMLAAIKAMPERRFDGETKQWLLNDDLEAVQQYLVAKGFQLESAA